MRLTADHITVPPAEAEIVPHPALDALIIRGLGAASWVARLLPWRFWHVAATCIGAVGMALPLRRTVLANVRHVRAGNPPPAVVAWYLGMQQIATHWKNVVSFLRTTVGSGASPDTLRGVAFDEMAPYLNERGIVIVAPHAGPFSATGMMIKPWLRRRGFRGPLAVVIRLARPFGSDGLMRWMRPAVVRAGVAVARADGPSSEMARILLSTLRAKGMVVLFVDEPMAAASSRVPFFDSSITLPLGPARIAKATGSVIVPCIMTYGRGKTSYLRFAPAIDPAPLAVDETQRRIARALEGLIAPHLDQWSMLTTIWPETTP